jgi:uncharacterized protein YbjT (DUF2867 family)
MNGKKRVLIAGATGFTGTHVLLEFLLHRDKYDIAVYARDPEKASLRGLPAMPVHVFYGALEQSEKLCEAMRGMDVFVNVASLGFGHAPGIIDACKKSGVGRALFVSTTGIYTKLAPASKSVRIAAEECIRSSGVSYTIIRPTMIFGTAEDRNICRLIRLLRWAPLITVPGTGSSLVQPVYVKDLANAIYSAADSPKTINREYAVSGKEALTFNGLINAVALALGRKIFIVHIPFALCTMPFVLFEKAGIKLPIKLEQILRLNEDKAFGHEDAARDFGYAPRPFAEAVAMEIADMREEK